MGNWTGKWKCSIPVKCKCDCEKDGGAEIYHRTFDADSLDSMQHDGETETYKVFHCEVCIAKHGKKIQID